MLKAPEYKRLKLQYDVLLSNFDFKFNLRRYTVGTMSIVLVTAEVAPW
jgi:hypothetical protein